MRGVIIETAKKITIYVLSLMVVCIVCYSTWEMVKKPSPYPTRDRDIDYYKRFIKEVDDLTFEERYLKYKKFKDETYRVYFDNWREELFEQQRKLEEKRKKQEEEKWMNFTLTAYVSDCYQCTGFTYYKEYDVRNTIYSPNGYRIVAVDPNVVKLGSLLEINMNGNRFLARAMDIGSAINNFDLDLLVSSVERANEIGVQQVKVKILKEGEGD